MVVGAGYPGTYPGLDNEESRRHVGSSWIPGHTTYDTNLRLILGSGGRYVS